MICEKERARRTHPLCEKNKSKELLKLTPDLLNHGWGLGPTGGYLWFRRAGRTVLPYQGGIVALPSSHGEEVIAQRCSTAPFYFSRLRERVHPAQLW